MSIRTSNSLFLASVFVLLSSGTVSAQKSNMALLDQIDGASVMLKGSDGKYMSVTGPWNTVRMDAKIVDDLATPFNESLKQIFKAHKTEDGYLILESAATGNNIQMTGPEVFSTFYRVLRAENKSRGGWEKFALFGSSLDNIGLWNLQNSVYVRGGSRVAYFVFPLPTTLNDGILWGQSGDNNLSFSFSIEIIEESPAMIAAKEKAKKAHDDEVAAAAKVEQEKAAAIQAAIDEKNFDVLKNTIAELEKKNKTQEMQIVAHEGELKHITDILTSKDKNQLAELKELLKIKGEEIVQVEQAKVEAKIEQVEQAKAAVQAEPVKVEAQVEPAKAAIKVEPAKTPVKKVTKKTATPKKKAAKKTSTKAKKSKTTKKVASKSGKTAKKVAAKKTTPAKKTVTKSGKPATKKTAKKTAKAKRPVAKKTTAKKTTAKKTTAKKTTAKKTAVKDQAPAPAPAPVELVTPEVVATQEVTEVAAQ